MGGTLILPQELLEAVLQYLDIKTLLFAQCVSRHWRTTIASSPRIQETLFYRPQTSDIIQYSSEWKGDKLHRFGPVETETTTPTNPSSITSTQSFTSIAINPLLVNEIYYSHLSPGVKRRGQRLVLPPLGAFLRHPTGTWRSMFLTRPPTASIVGVSLNRKGEILCDVHFSEVNCTLGGLVDRMLVTHGYAASSAAAAIDVWHVMFVDTVELDHLAIDDEVAKYVDGSIAPAGKLEKASRRVEHPHPPFFSSWPEPPF